MKEKGSQEKVEAEAKEKIADLKRKKEKDRYSILRSLLIKNLSEKALQLNHT